MIYKTVSDAITFQNVFDNYAIIKGSLSGISYFKYSIIKILFNEKEEYNIVCETLDLKYAELVCNVLNNSGK